jgi:adenosylhomocysteine nucleosidase
MSNSTILVVAALSQEFSALRKYLQNESVSEEDGIRCYTGDLAGRPVALVVSGVGIQNAARATRLAVRKYSPRMVISIGYAGGLAPKAGPGTIILPTLARVSDTSNGEMAPDAEMLKLAQAAASQIRQTPLGGTILTVPAVIATREAKKALRTSTGAVAVDMESTAVGAACREAGVRVVFMRCITDGADDEIPINKEISAAFRGRIRILPFLFALVKHPSVALTIWRLSRRAHRASRTLGQLVLAFCQALP